MDTMKTMITLSMMVQVPVTAPALLPLLHGSPDEFLLLPEVREFPFIVHAHRAAHEDEVGGIRAGHCTGFAEPDVFEGDIVFSEDLLKVPGRFGGLVLEDRDLHAVQIPACLPDKGWPGRAGTCSDLPESGPFTSPDSPCFSRNRHGFLKNRQGFTNVQRILRRRGIAKCRFIPAAEPGRDQTVNEPDR
jgi:hypothetical protein